MERNPDIHKGGKESLSAACVPSDSDGCLRAIADIGARLQNDKKNILYVLHADFRADANSNVGGTQFHVKDLMTHMRQDQNVFVLARDGGILRLTAYLADEQITFKFPVGPVPTFQQFHDKTLAETYRQILAAFSIDLVHVHHMIDLSFDVFTVARDMGIPLLLTLHDYYYICPTIKLLENGETYCGGCGKNCAACLQDQLGYAEQTNYLPVWREKCREMLALCDGLIIPSEAAKAVYTGVYPELAEKIRVIGHGMDDLSRPAPEDPAPQPPKTRKRIAFLGGLNPEKGSRIAYDLIRKSGNAYDWYLIGGIRDPNLFALDRKNVHKTDWYAREEVCNLLRQHQIDLVCIFSIWPETFCYTLSEAELAGVPVLAADMGALGERIRREQTGWLMDLDTPPKAVLQRIKEIFADDQNYTETRDRVTAFRHKTLLEMCREYDALYAALPAPQKQSHPFDPQKIYSAYVMGQSAGEIRGTGAEAQLLQRIEELEETIRTIHSSTEYKMARFLTHGKYPCKRLIRRLMGFAYRVYGKLRRKK